MGYSVFLASDNSLPQADATQKIPSNCEAGNPAQDTIKDPKASSAPYSCHQCMKSFTTSGSYGRHVRSRCKGPSNVKVNEVKSQSKLAAMTAKIPLSEPGKDSTLKKELDSLL